MAWHTESDTRHEIRATTLILLHTGSILLLGGFGGGVALNPAFVEGFWIACLLLWGHSLRAMLALGFAMVQAAVLTESGLYFYLLPAIVLALGGTLITGRIQKDHNAVPLAFAAGWMGLTTLVGWFYTVTNSRAAVPHYSTQDVGAIFVATFMFTALIRLYTFPANKDIL